MTTLLQSLSGTVCILTLASSIFFGYQFIQTAKSSDQMRDIDLSCRNLLITMLDAETGQRGYLITGNPAYLEPYQAGITSTNEKLDALGVASTHSEQILRVKDINRLVALKLDELDKTIKLRATDFTAAQAEVNENLGKNLMDSIRQQIDEIQLWSSSQYENYRNQSVTYGRISFFSMIVSLACGFLTAFISKMK